MLTQHNTMEVGFQGKYQELDDFPYTQNMTVNQIKVYFKVWNWFPAMHLFLK